MSDEASVRVAVDTGGTFTDVVAVLGDRRAVAKVPSTPEDPAAALRAGVAQVLAELGAPIGVLLHGTTVATNALLEGAGAPTWLVTNRGFEDVLRIGRQARPQLYTLAPELPAPVVPPERCVGVVGRIGADGEELEALDTEGLDAVLAGLDEAPQSWAVSLLHAYANPVHEQAVGAYLRARRPQDVVSLSSEVLPVFREVERTSTTVANAFVRPRMARYLGRLEREAPQVSVMSSSGGLLDLAEASAQPVRTALSGPAGGVVAALDVARRLGREGVLSFDMGGTSTDVALCRGRLPLRHASQVGHFALHVPSLDIHTVGAGGGSLAWVDDGGALRVGPRSAGADPGPACYGRGTQATVTDANVVLGRLPADTLLGGHMRLHLERAERAVADLAAELGCAPQEAALGIVKIAVETMAGAIRRVSVERGVDPRGLPLCAFGGAGALHACELAEALGMREVVVPTDAGLLSACGMLLGAPVAERGRTVLGAEDAGIAAQAAALEAEARGALGAPATRTAVALEMRYRGQSFELAVPLEAGDVAAARRAFEEAHDARFGYRLDAPVEGVTLRVRAEGAAAPPLPAAEPPGSEVLRGPCAVARLSMTLWVAPGWTGRWLEDGALWLEREA